MNIQYFQSQILDLSRDKRCTFLRTQWRLIQGTYSANQNPIASQGDSKNRRLHCFCEDMAATSAGITKGIVDFLG